MKYLKEYFEFEEDFEEESPINTKYNLKVGDKLKRIKNGGVYTIREIVFNSNDTEYYGDRIFTMNNGNRYSIKHLGDFFDINESFEFEEDFEEDAPQNLEYHIKDKYGKEEIVVKIENIDDWNKFIDIINDTNLEIKWTTGRKFKKDDWRFSDCRYVYIDTLGKVMQSSESWYEANYRSGGIVHHVF